MGNKNFVAVNREYPEGWSIRVLRIVAEGSEVVSEVEVPHDEFGVFRVASFWTVQEGRIARGREYWTSVGADRAARSGGRLWSSPCEAALPLAARFRLMWP
ncbi:hypothetical protein [Streptomyces sp. NPDC002328]|uniref:hypothetical protein n=1 Tax=Streptomyces sp. NPDC002328 TaxID=3364642 RepID=UPI003693A980